MLIKVLLADDSEIMRNAIRSLLSKREDIAVVGEASNIRETIQKTAELHPDLIIFDVHLVGGDRIPLTGAKSLLNGAKVLAISLRADDETRELAASVGAVKLLDKMYLSDRLIPAILELGEVQSSSATA
jgi:two-component system, chemotaxis family, protein-glutamate methylesterase/glutaminase